MSAAKELTAHNLIPNSSAQNPQPVTIASAATIAPTNFLSFVSGNTAIATITPPADGAHMLCLIFTHATPAAFTTSGNMKAVSTPTQNVPIFAIYNPIEAKYYVK